MIIDHILYLSPEAMIADVYRKYKDVEARKRVEGLRAPRYGPEFDYCEGWFKNLKNVLKVFVIMIINDNL